jgi:hypothetical protein
LASKITHPRRFKETMAKVEDRELLKSFVRKLKKKKGPGEAKKIHPKPQKPDIEVQKLPDKRIAVVKRYKQQ